MDLLLFLFAVAIVLLAWKLRQMLAAAACARREAQTLREEKTAIYRLLHDLGEAFTRSPDIAALMGIVARSSMEITRAQGAAVLELKPGQKQALILATSGRFPPLSPMSREVLAKLADHPEFLDAQLRATPLSSDTDLIVTVLDSGALYLPDATRSRLLPVLEHPLIRWISCLAVPLRYRGENYGVLMVANSTDITSFSQADLDTLHSIGTQATYAMHNTRVYGELLAKRELDHEIEVAKEIQRILLPDTCPEIEGWDIEAVNLPARDVSGDYYDFIPLRDGKLGIVIADVSGKGIPASLVMTMCRAALRSHAERLDSPAAVLCALNRQLYPDIREDMFVTLTYAVLDPASRQVSMARAGHEAPLFYRGGKIELIRSPGMAIGIDSGEVFDTVIAETSFQFELGDAFVLYTDGVTEALNPEGKEFGRECLMETVQRSARHGGESILREILEQLDSFRSTADKYDDITLITAYAQ